MGITVVLLTQRGSMPQIIAYPDAWTIPLVDVLNTCMEALIAQFHAPARAVSAVLNWAFSGIQTILVETPWIVPVSLFSLVAWQAGGWRLLALTVVLLFYILSSGYWVPTMNTLSLVLVALPLSVLVGFVLGYLGFRSTRAQKVILPFLDLMQTIPAFAYLIPILLLFGFGPVVGLIASVVFAIPPMVRNTMLGFQSIPAAILESAQMQGCTRRQQFAWAEFPTALPQMLIGVNQTTMATLSMIIIAAIIGGFEDIGWEVLSAMRKAQFGQSLLSGVVIVFLAILLDRITAAFAARELPNSHHSGLPWRQFLGLVLMSTALAFLMGNLFPAFAQFPAGLTFSPAQALNNATEQFVQTYGSVLGNIKNKLQFFLLLPVKIGLDKSVAPFTWGFEFTPTLRIGYWFISGLVILWAYAKGRWKIGVALMFQSAFLFFGATGLPWISVFLMLALLAYQLGGLRLAALAGGTIVYLLLLGLWDKAAISIYLCSVAVLLCVIFGGLIGILAASSDIVSKFIRPINDMLQTLPQFVLLIPALMLFQVGDFTALIAIVAYAIVPMIRYTEHGLRSVPSTLIDVGVACGCSPWQLFWQVRLPQATPQILVGVNQTVLYSLGMLVIAALVGTTGLGQEIYVALGKANAGAGLAAGLGMALIAMTADRILQVIISQL